MKDQTNVILSKVSNSRLDKYKLTKLILQKEGATLLCGSSEETKELRCLLLEAVPQKDLKALYDRNEPTGTIKSHSHMIKPLASKKWFNRGPWALDFVNTVGLPEIFAGVKTEETLPSYFSIPPRTILPPLQDYQVAMKNEMLKILENKGNKSRSMITLPTGGGKTRIAVQAFIEWMLPRFENGRFLIWIAQSEELCEQAISCIGQIWSDTEYNRDLKVYRYFGGREISEDKFFDGGVIVTSISQIYNRIKRDAKEINIILKGTGAIIIDEAHRAASHMYDVLFDKAQAICGDEAFPVCGLSATPGRADDKTDILVGRFMVNLIQPPIGDEYNNNPMKYFRDKGYLAKAKHITYKSNLEYEVSERELQSKNPEIPDEDIPPGFLKRLSLETDRNIKIIKRLQDIKPGTPTLIFACTVQHAEMLSSIMNLLGRKSGVISSGTPASIRRNLISRFKKGEIEFLFNFGVLTTGFDAPKTECIALLRPTTSKILYEQIVGRGMRGPTFGGTPECTVIDFADNIIRFGESMAYVSFKHLWVEELEEQAKEH